MTEMEQNAKRWKLLVDRKIIQKKYISDQTGLTTAEVNAFLELAEDMDRAEGFDYNTIDEKLKLFFDSELTVGSFRYIEDTKFSAILRNLQDEFHLSASELEKLIKTRMKDDYFDLQRENDAEVMVGFLDYQIRKYGIDHIIDTPEILEAKRKKQKELSAECDRIDNLLTYGISFVAGIDLETDEYIVEEYNFSPQEISDMNKQHSELQMEIIQLKTEISQLLHQDEQDWEEYRALLRQNTSADDSTFSEAFRIVKSVSKTNRKKIAKEDYAYNAVQQKAILELFFDLCTDQDGNVLPEHFGSGIQLTDIIEEKFIWIGSGWKNTHGIQKVTHWATAQNLNLYDYNDSLDKIDSNDPVYQLIAEHQQVFFHDPSVYEMESVMEMLKDLPRDAVHKLYHKLMNETFPMIGRTETERAYSKILSEYYDILSLQTPVANPNYYRKENLYSIVYEIALASNGSIQFSNELVHSVFLRIHFNAKHWQWQMYLSQYYYHHKEFESLVAYIEKEVYSPEA